jgi:hypothetical protein
MRPAVAVILPFPSNSAGLSCLGEISSRNASVATDG